MHEYGSCFHKELDQAVELHRAGETDKARIIYERVLENEPNDPDANHLLGVVLLEAGDHEKARHRIEKAIKINPEAPHYHNSLGEVLRHEGKIFDAILAYENALRLKEDYVEAWRNLAGAFRSQGDLGSAVSCLHKAVELEPTTAETHCMLGNIYRLKGEEEKAISCFRKAIDISPENCDAHYNMGMAFKEMFRPEDAVRCFQHAVRIKPDLVDAYNTMGIVFKDMGKMDSAAACYRKAIALSPDLSEAYQNLGNLHEEQGRLDEAIGCYEKSLEISPDHGDVYNQLVRQLETLCEWSKLDRIRRRLDVLNARALERGERCPEMPLVHISRCPDPSQNLLIATSWADSIHRSIFKRHKPFVQSKRSDPRITLGYISNDFRNHAVAHLIAGLFKRHDRNAFRVFCYSYGPNDESTYRRRIESDCDRFRDIRHLSDRAAAKSIYEDKVDILVDLMGHTRGSRMAICAYRPAPVMTTYLGYPGTTGAHFFDYLITDKIITPQGHADYYSEHLVYMPHTYQINDRQAIADQTSLNRRPLGLPDDAFVFCSFNQCFKIEPVMFSAWMRILNRVPDSVLWLLVQNRTAQFNLRREARARGVSPDRIVFAGNLAKSEHLARHGFANLALDTRIYNGHTTTSDALWAGVPVVTLCGSHFASRVSASLLNAIGCSELAASSLKEFEDLCVHLAHNRHALNKLKAKLAGNRMTHPLFDTARFAVNIEKAFKEMWRIYSEGEKPSRIDVVET